MLPHLIAITYPLSLAYPLSAGFFDLPRFVTLGLTGAAVGWGTSSYRRAQAALRERERLLTKARDELETAVAERTAHLSASEERYARAMQASNDGIWEWNPDTDEIFMSDRARQLWAVPDGVAVRTRAELKRLGGFHPEDFQRTEEVIAANRLPEAHGFDMEYRVIGPGGELRWVRSQAKAFAGPQGRPVLVTGSLTDVTDRKLVAEALRESQERYALAVAASSDGIWDWDLVTDQQFFSERAQRMFGLEPGPAVRPRSDWDALREFHPEDAPRRRAAMERHFAGETPIYEGEWRVRPIGGEYRWVQSRGLCVRDAAGRPIRMVGSVTDIDERKGIEAALRQSEERYSLAMEATEEGHFDVNLDTDELFTSERLNEIYGFAPGTRFAKRNEYLTQVRFYGNDAEIYHAGVRAAEARGGPERYEFEYRILRPSGEVRWVRTRGKVTRDAEGRARRRTGVVADITERKLGEEALRESQERYALAVAGSDDGVWDCDFAARRVFVSARARELAGMPPGPEMVPMDEWFASLPIHPEDLPRRIATMQAHLAGKTPAYVGEFRLRQPDGVYRWRRLHGLCLRDADGNPHRMAGSISDVDARRRAEEALRLSEERYALALEASEEGHFDNDLEADEIFVSARVNEIYGFPRQARTLNRTEFLNQIPFHPDDRHVLAELSRLDWQDPPGDLYEIECRIVPRPGETRWIHSRAKVVRDAEGRPRRRVGVVADITERKLAAEALRVSEERYAYAMEAAQDAHWDWIVATDQYYTSPRVVDVFGLPPGTTFTSRVDYLAKTPLVKEDLDVWLRATRELFAGTGSRLSMELRAIINGEVRWIQHNGLCVRDTSGRAVRWCGSVRDVTERRRAEEALRLSEERYALAMEVSEEGHFDWNAQTDEIFASEHLKKVLDLPAGIEYRTRSDMVSRMSFWPGESERVAQMARDVLAGGALQHEFEYRLRQREAEEPRWVHARWKIFRDANGVAQRVIGVVSDITERKLGAEALRESEARFRTLTELSSDWYWAQDENLRFTYWSDDWAGYPGGPIGKTRWELEGVALLSGSWAEHQAVLAARQRFRDLEYSRVALDGTIRYVGVSGAPVFDEQGRFRGYQGIARDITERKRIEEELRSRQEMLELAQKSARAIAFEWKIGEGEGENRWSPDLEAMYGFAPGTYDGTFETWKKCVHPEDWPAVKEAVRHAHRTGEVASEYRVVHPDGSVHWLQARGRMLFDAMGNATHMVGFMQDITQRKQAEEELRKMEQELRRAQRLEAIGTLAGGIAHDFNNILGAILGYGEMAMRDAKEGTRLRRDLDSIIAAGERGRTLVDRILAFSRSGVGERVPVHVEAVVREALDQVAASLPESVTIRPRLHAGRAAILGDSTQVHQVVMNLASNAVQAMPQGGMLGVALETARFDAARPATVGSIVPGDYIVLRVSDTGTGIPDDVLERMFDPFFTTKEVGVGSGLGLSLVHGIVTSVGGAIDVATELGKSTTFTVYLRRSGDAQEQRADEDLPLPRGEGQRVLVVDDEEPLVRLATETLEELGYVALGFTSSAAALEAIRADPQRFDAMITDERMPGMTGSALIRQVRGIRDGIPILLVTGFVGGGAIDRARDAGADEVLKKPLSARELATSLARVLRL